MYQFREILDLNFYLPELRQPPLNLSKVMKNLSYENSYKLIFLRLIYHEKRTFLKKNNF